MAVTLPSQLPYPSSFVYCIVNIKQFMNFLYLISYGCLRLWFLDAETYPGPRHPAPAVCRILCSNAWGLARNLSDLTVASFQYDILFCSETLVSDMRHVSEVLVGPMGWPWDASGPWDGCIRSRWLQSISPTLIWVWLLRNASFYGLWYETEPSCVQSLSQPWPRWPDFFIVY